MYYLKLFDLNLKLTALHLFQTCLHLAFEIELKCLCPSVSAQKSRGDQLPAAAAAAPGLTEPQPSTAAVPGLLTTTDQYATVFVKSSDDERKDTPSIEA